MNDETENIKPDEPPKTKRKPKAEIVPLPPPIEIRLGSLAIADPKEMIHRAAGLAKALSQIIHKQKLYVVIKNKKFVVVEGWTTMGAMLGVVPIEVSCDPLPDNKGYKAVIKLVRLNDGMQVGGASAICNAKEHGWNPDDEYATHSKAITRATGKAFRLSFAWVMKLAGFEATPAGELFEVEGSEEQADEVAKKKIEEHLDKTFNTLAEAEAAYRESQDKAKGEKKTAQESVFVTWPDEHHGNKALILGRVAIMKFGALAYIEREAHGTWNERAGGWYVPAADVTELVRVLEGLQCPLIKKENPYGNSTGGASAAPILGGEGARG